MLRRNTVIVLAVFVIALGLAFFVQRNVEAPGDATSTPRPSHVFIGEGVGIDRLTIESESGGSLSLEKTAEDEWELVGIEEGDPDNERINSVVSQLRNFRIITDLENPPELREIGLEPPQFVLTAVFDNGAQKVIHIGSLTPTRSGYYVLFGEAGPMVVDQSGLQRAIELIDELPLVPTPTVTAQPTDG